MYGDTSLGATDEAMLTFFKSPMNKPTFDALKAHVYPEFVARAVEKPVEVKETIEEVPEKSIKKTTSKK